MPSLVRVLALTFAVLLGAAAVRVDRRAHGGGTGAGGGLPPQRQHQGCRQCLAPRGSARRRRRGGGQLPAARGGRRALGRALAVRGARGRRGRAVPRDGGDRGLGEGVPVAPSAIPDSASCAPPSPCPLPLRGRGFLGSPLPSGERAG